MTYTLKNQSSNLIYLPSLETPLQPGETREISEVEYLGSADMIDRYGLRVTQTTVENTYQKSGKKNKKSGSEVSEISDES